MVFRGYHQGWSSDGRAVLSFEHGGQEFYLHWAQWDLDFFGIKPGNSFVLAVDYRGPEHGYAFRRASEYPLPDDLIREIEQLKAYAIEMGYSLDDDE